MRLDPDTTGAFALYAALLERQPRRKALGPP
jgi:hypothetical protein